MSLASPLALLWLAALIPVVIFYILKIRLRRVPVSTIVFWRQIYDEHQPRSIWQRLRHWLSLLAQVVLILLLVGALADPYFSWETRQLRRIVVILDTSASMNAADVSPSRLAAAKGEALRVIQGMRFRDELALVTAGGVPRVACGFSSHGRTLSHAVDDILPTDNPTRVSAAIELAQRLLGERHDEHQHEIVLLTDVEQDFNLPVPVISERSRAGGKPASQVIVRRFGTNAGNVGITQFQVRRSLIDPLGYEILAEVTNASDESVECRLEIDLNEEVVDVVPLTLTPGQHWHQSFEKTSTNGGHLMAKLDRADTLTADNRAWAVLPKREMLPVTLVSEGNHFLQKVFESNPLVALTRIAPSGQKSEAAPNADGSIAVLHRQIPNVLPIGSVLVIDPRGSCDAWRLGEPIQNPIVHQQDKDSPLLGHVRLDNVVMPEARKLEFTIDEGVKVLARSLAGDPLLATIERPGQKVLLLTVNLEEGDLPLRTAFPILMMNALNWFTENRGELRESLPTGAITEIDVASLNANPRRGANSQHGTLSMIAPDGRRSVLSLQSDRLSLGPFDQCGVWRVIVSDPNSKMIDTTVLALACNLADRNESDVRVSQAVETAPSSVVSANLLGNRPVWFWLIVLAWLLMAAEWWAYQRRVMT